LRSLGLVCNRARYLLAIPAGRTSVGWRASTQRHPPSRMQTKTRRLFSHKPTERHSCQILPRRKGSGPDANETVTDIQTTGRKRNRHRHRHLKRNANPANPFDPIQRVEICSRSDKSQLITRADSAHHPTFMGPSRGLKGGPQKCKYSHYRQITDNFSKLYQ